MTNIGTVSASPSAAMSTPQTQPGGMSSVSKSIVPLWVDTTPGGFQIIKEGHWTPGSITEPMHRLGSRELQDLYGQYDALLGDTRVDDEKARSFNDFRKKYFHGGAVVESAPQLLFEAKSGGTQFLVGAGSGIATGAIAGVLAGRKLGTAAGVIAGLATGAAAAYGSASLVRNAELNSHQDKLDAFKDEYARQVADPAINALIQFEGEVFRAERDPAREADIDEKAELLVPAIINKVDRNGDSLVDVEGADSEIAALSSPYNWRHLDLSADGQVDAQELEAGVKSDGKYQLARDDTFMTDPYYDKDQDGLLDTGKKFQNSVPANGTNNIFEEYTARK